MPTPPRGLLRAPRFIAVAVGALSAWACGGAAFTVASQGADAGPTVDAGVDAPPPFCASRAGQYDFCSDFDEEALPENWDTPILKVGASSVTEDSADWRSPPISVLMDTPPLGPAGDAGPLTATAALQKRALPHGDATLAFDVRLTQLSFPNANDKTAAITLLGLGFGKDYLVGLTLVPAPGGGPYALALIEIPSLSATVVQPKATPIKALPQLAGWSHVKIGLVTVAAAVPPTITVTITIDTSNPQSIPITPPATALAGERTMTLGALAQGACGEAKVRFDNVIWSH
jgi:hypothetical protein